MQPTSPTRESRFRRELREELIARIDEQGLREPELAAAMGLLPAGASALLQRQDWSLATCLRVAESLKVEVRPQVGSQVNADARVPLLRLRVHALVADRPHA